MIRADEGYNGAMELTPEDVAQAREVLKGVSFYDHLQPSELEELLKGFEKTATRPGEVLITQGKTGEVFYILASGSVGVFQQGKLIDKKIATLGPNSFFGEMALLDHDVRTAHVIVEEPGFVFTLVRATFEGVLLRNPQLAAFIRKTAAARRSQLRDLERGGFGKG